MFSHPMDLYAIVNFSFANGVNSFSLTSFYPDFSVPLGLMSESEAPSPTISCCL